MKALAVVIIAVVAFLFHQPRDVCARNRVRGHGHRRLHDTGD